MTMIVIEHILYVVTVFLVYFAGRNAIRYLFSRHSLKKEEPTPEIDSDQASVDLKGINSAEDILDYLEMLEKATTDEEVIELTRLFDNPNRASIKKEAERQAQAKHDLEARARQAKINSVVERNDSVVASRLPYYDAKREEMVVPTELLEDYPLTNHDYEIKTRDRKGGYTYICTCYWCGRERTSLDHRHPGGSYSPGAS